jgi:hypothetical protein
VTSPTTQLELVARERRNDAISPTPWAVERTNANGWKGISIKDADGLFIAYMVMQPGGDNEMHNAKAIVAAVNELHPKMTDKEKT